MLVESLDFTLAVPSVQDLPLRLESATARIALTLDAKRHITGMPREAPPELPRMLIASPRWNVHVGLDRVQLSYPVDGTVADNVGTAFKYFHKRLTSPDVEPIFGAVHEPAWTGLVLRLAEPANAGLTGIEAVEALASRLVSIKPFGEKLASFNLLYGFSRGGLFRNVTIQGFDSYQVQVTEGKAAAPMKMGAGIQYILDVNSKAAPMQPFQKSQVLQLLGQLETFYNELPAILGVP